MHNLSKTDVNRNIQPIQSLSYLFQEHLYLASKVCPSCLKKVAQMFEISAKVAQMFEILAKVAKMLEILTKVAQMFEILGKVAQMLEILAKVAKFLVA